MVRAYVMLLIVCVSLSGCATVPSGPVIGSQGWYDGRMQEINQAYVQGQLTKEEQLKLKNETDSVRLTYQRDEEHQMDRQMRWNSSVTNRFGRH